MMWKKDGILMKLHQLTKTYVILHLRLVLAFVITLILFKRFGHPSSSGHFMLKQAERNCWAREFLSSRAKVV